MMVAVPVPKYQKPIRLGCFAKVSKGPRHERYTLPFLLYHLEVIRISLIPVRMNSDIEIAGVGNIRRSNCAFKTS